VLMRIFIGERDQWHHRSLADALVELTTVRLKVA